MAAGGSPSERPEQAAMDPVTGTITSLAASRREAGGVEG